HGSANDGSRASGLARGCRLPNSPYIMSQAATRATGSETFVYKVFLPEQFTHLQTYGSFDGSPDDLRDGFVHLSFAHQLHKTITKHFAHYSELVIAEFQVAALGAALRLEPSRDGQLFPHLHAPLLAEQLTRCVSLAEVIEL